MSRKELCKTFLTRDLQSPIDEEHNLQLSISQKIKNAIREIPDFPKPGINFYDITTILQNGALFRELTAVFCEHLKPKKVDAIVGIEARGFIFGASIAQSLGLGFIPVRKPGKLPHDTESITYNLEYGDGSLEIHADAITAGQQVVLVDDLLATGGTARGSIELIKRLGGNVLEALFVIELSGLNGRSKLSADDSTVPVFSLVNYEL